MKLDTALYARLLREAADNPRLRQATDLRTSPADQSQRMLNALLPGTAVPCTATRTPPRPPWCSAAACK